MISPLDTKNLHPKHNSHEWLTANDHTRLIGFRTTKRCRSDKQIMSIQPIYYSIDERMCKSYVDYVSQELYNEIPAYGAECSDV